MLKQELAPLTVWHAFEEISRLPRGHDNKVHIAEYIYGDARTHGLESTKDSNNNVTVRIEATVGREEEDPVMIEAHMGNFFDNSEASEHGFEDEGIELMVEGDLLMANGSPLGADEGIGIAMMMALMRDHKISHPRLVLFFTADETRGMASELSKDNWLINLDYTEGRMLINGTSGIMVSQLVVDAKKDSLFQDEVLHLTLSGLPGGHSALEIQKESSNAIVLMGRILTEVKDLVTLVDISSEQSFNVTPTMAEALIITEEPSLVAVKLTRLLRGLKKEMSSLKEAELQIEKEMMEGTCYERETFEKLLAALALVPSGHLAQDPVTGMTTFSNNLYRIREEEHKIIIGNMTKYACQTMGNTFNDRLNYLAELLKAEVNILGNVPVWEPKAEETLIKVTKDIYHIKTNHVMDVKTCHSAAETAVLTREMEATDAIVIGPDIRHAHTVNESISITSVQRTYSLLKSLLASY